VLLGCRFLSNKAANCLILKPFMAFAYDGLAGD